MPPPKARHGQVCANVVFLLKRFLSEHDLGHVLSNDSGVITERGPDSVRGPDVSFYSYAKLPKGPLPQAYPDVAPDLVFEVLSPDDRWASVFKKVGEYLDAGVAFVLVLDPEIRAIHRFVVDQPATRIGSDAELHEPSVLGPFRSPVAQFFE